ncbi:uncharacterized protein RCC_00243 [Ramularia collo-cygni]|uniref:Uncharacterized protein n=1 Tax=Ramularia collo-cygni TaxID=112498 RepID=A0A2D3UMT3_9PEZI|nr:uncharacterized protein RCC_00243 [Ramularia collo-cygni]
MQHCILLKHLVRVNQFVCH